MYEITDEKVQSIIAEYGEEKLLEIMSGADQEVFAHLLQYTAEVEANALKFIVGIQDKEVAHKILFQLSDTLNDLVEALGYTPRVSKETVRTEHHQLLSNCLELHRKHYQAFIESRSPEEHLKARIEEQARKEQCKDKNTAH